MPPRVRSRPTLRTATHASLPFFVFAQLFGASVSHFLVSLSHFWYSELSYFSYSELSYFSYRANSFYNFCQPFCYSDLTHFVREFSHSSLLQYSVILATVVAIFATLISHFVFCYSGLSHFMILSAIFHCYSELGHFAIVTQPFSIATVLSHFSLL
jgi:hypothetical protein